VDAVAVDSNVLILARRRNPELRHELRVLESWGPLPIQPVVASPEVPEDLRQQIVRHLCRMGSLPVGRELLDDLWMAGFAPAEEAPYRELQRTYCNGNGNGNGAAAALPAQGSMDRPRKSRLRYFLNSLF
jgi:ABC-type phosphate/phosphonate transport system substrate-binding protein